MQLSLQSPTEQCQKTEDIANKTNASCCVEACCKAYPKHIPTAGSGKTICAGIAPCPFPFHNSLPFPSFPFPSLTLYPFPLLEESLPQSQLWGLGSAASFHSRFRRSRNDKQILVKFAVENHAPHSHNQVCIQFTKKYFLFLCYSRWANNLRPFISVLCLQHYT